MQQIGRYKIVNELGRGAMGVVFRALDPAIGRTVAIKTFKLSELADPTEREKIHGRLFREAHSAGILSHPGIVTIYDIAEEGDLAYIAMEYVNGATLEKVMLSVPPPTQQQVLRMLRETAGALDYAHQKGIIHRDIKPANIMINEAGSVKITDFGVAKILSHNLTQADTILGTPNYMSPEQIEAKGLDGRSDQFALAVIAYELLTGEKPFVADSLPTLIFKIVREEPLAPQHLNPTIGGEVGDVIRKALSKPRDQRFATCTEFAAALEAALIDKPGWMPQSKGAVQSMATVVTLTPENEPAPAVEPPKAAPPKLDIPPLDPDAVTFVPSSPKRRNPEADILPLTPAPPAQAAAAPPAALETKAPPPKPVETPVAKKPEPAPAKAATPPQTKKSEPARPAAEALPEPPKLGVRHEKEAAPASPGKTRYAVMGIAALVLIGAGFFAWQEFFAGGQSAAPPDQAATTPSAPPAATPSPEQPKPAEPVATEPPKPAAAPPPVATNPPAAVPATKPPVAAAAKEVTAEIATTPPGATIVFDRDAAKTCTSPCSIPLAPGRHVYTTSLAGYRPTTRIFELPKESQQAVTLERQSGTVMVSSTPAGATIVVNGQTWSQKTPAILTLPAGSHKIQLNLQGHPPYEESVEVKDGVSRHLSIDFSGR